MSEIRLKYKEGTGVNKVQKRDNMLLLQQKFTKEMLEKAVILPSVFLDAYTQLGLSDHDFINVLKLLAYNRNQEVKTENMCNICNITESEAEELRQKLISLSLLEIEKTNTLNFSALYNSLFEFHR